MPEIRFDADKEHCAVLDGYCSATGKHRSEVMGHLLAEFAIAKRREAILICRVAGVNPHTSEPERQPNGI
jgi:hypothetical protein